MKEKPKDLTFRAGSREKWRAWLESNHEKEKVVWVVFPKKHTGDRSMSYDDSVEEALCFGWIDSIIKRVDDDTFARKFTPRTDCGNWSEINRKRLDKCISEGRMTPAGLAKVGDGGDASRPRPAIPKAGPPPAFMTKALKASPLAWAAFTAMAPSHQRRYTLWITMAKRQETREKRLQEAIRLLEKNETLGLK
jgi:uncharacterized protein YdeI (YjbR/CyaY-like superfamily)